VTVKYILKVFIYKIQNRFFSFLLEVCSNDYCRVHSIPFPWNHSHSHPISMPSLIPYSHSHFFRHLYSHSLPFPFPMPEITIFRILKADKCVTSRIQNKNHQVTPEALYTVILNHCYLSLIIISWLTVSKLCSLIICHCTLLCKTGLFYIMYHSHAHNIIRIPIPINSPMGFRWESHSRVNSHSHAHL